MFTFRLRKFKRVTMYSVFLPESLKFMTLYEVMILSLRVFSVLRYLVQFICYVFELLILYVVCSSLNLLFGYYLTTQSTY